MYLNQSFQGRALVCEACLRHVFLPAQLIITGLLGHHCLKFNTRKASMTFEVCVSGEGGFPTSSLLREKQVYFIFGVRGTPFAGA